ncbi:MAG TPA: DUF4282 domain-containing protein [Phycisphaerales bacterium]|nr:DUF4282 domain-containing protein [Phycisphaerales bacterium]
MEEFLRFKRFITPLFIHVLFWIGTIASVISGAVMLVTAIAGPRGQPGLALAGVLYIVLGPIVARLYCELLMVVFSIHDAVRDIRNHLLNQRP